MSRRIRRARTWAAASGLLAAAGAQATVCTISASAIAFGTYDPVAGAGNDSTATVQVTCVPGVGDPLTTTYTLTIAGTGTGNDATRSIASGAQRLYFQVYKDASRSTVWGNGSTSGAGVGSGVTSAATAVPAVRSHTVYARAAAGQNVAPGTYAGTLLATIGY